MGIGSSDTSGASQPSLFHLYMKSYLPLRLAVIMEHSDDPIFTRTLAPGSRCLPLPQGVPLFRGTLAPLGKFTWHLCSSAPPQSPLILLGHPHPGAWHHPKPPHSRVLTGVGSRLPMLSRNARHLPVDLYHLLQDPSPPPHGHTTFPANPRPQGPLPERLCYRSRSLDLYLRPNWESPFL